MNLAIEIALESPAPSRSLEILGRLAPGLETTRVQIQCYSEYWAVRARNALDSDAPLLVAMGDSLAQGVGASDPALSYVGRLETMLHSGSGVAHGVVNLSRSGARIDDVLGTQVTALAELGRAPAVIVCTVGSNDLLHSTRVVSTRDKMTSLMETLPSRSILATLPDTASLMPKMLNRHIRGNAEQHELLVADVAHNLGSWRGKTAGDRFHPNDRGHEVWADTFASVIAGIL